MEAVSLKKRICEQFLRLGWVVTAPVCKKTSHSLITENRGESLTLQRGEDVNKEFDYRFHV
jgi:hypothetical protein